MVNRKPIVDEIIKGLEKEEITNQSGTFSYIIYGPQGCGKSFVVYQLAATLMKDKNNFVVYINKAIDENLIFDIVCIIDLKLTSLGINDNNMQNALQKILTASLFLNERLQQTRMFIYLAKILLKSKYFNLLF